MARYYRDNFKVADFVRWHDRQELVLQPKFQRRAAWGYKARSYLIDTIIRQLPMPKVYLRRVVRPSTQLTAYEVVDGQQRLRAILDFRSDGLVLSHNHHAQLGDTTFSQLPAAVQRDFMIYEISTEVIEDASDREVWGMFERLNTYTLTLNRQEKLNAEYTGYFKRACYELAAEQYSLDAWKSLRVFGDRAISRMKEVELTSDILVAIVRGISDITAIRAAYDDFDDRFDGSERVAGLFREAFRFQVNELAAAIRESKFHLKTWFYSLMVATTDALSGIPRGLGPKPLRPGGEVVPRMLALDTALRAQPEQLPDGLASLKLSLGRATSHVPQREERHRNFFAMVTFPPRQWEEHWQRMTR